MPSSCQHLESCQHLKNCHISIAGCQQAQKSAKIVKLNCHIGNPAIWGGYRAHATKLIGESVAELQKRQPSKVKCDQLIRLLNGKQHLLQVIDNGIFKMLDEDEIENEDTKCISFVTG